MALPSPTRFMVEIDAQALIDGGADSRDAALALRIVNAANELQDAMDTAARQGLILEPNFRRYASSSSEIGSGADSFVCKVGIYRRLA